MSGGGNKSIRKSFFRRQRKSDPDTHLVAKRDSLDRDRQNAPKLARGNNYPILIFPENPPQLRGISYKSDENSHRFLTIKPKNTSPFYQKFFLLKQHTIFPIYPFFLYQEPFSFHKSFWINISSHKISE